VWRVILGLRLAWQRSPEHVGGWKIASRGDSWITLEATSWFLSANIVLCVEAELLSVATIIRYDRPIAALIWPPVSIFHRQAMPGLLRQALSRPSSTVLRPPAVLLRRERALHERLPTPGPSEG
jgi:hypothetical protein